MNFQGIYDRIRSIQAPGVTGMDEPREPNPQDKKDKGRSGDPYVLVDPQRLPEFLECLRDDPSLKFELMADLTATDPSKEDGYLWINVQLLSLVRKHRLAVKCLLPKENAVMPSSVSVHRGAQWAERECSEMYGITFEGHPDPRNILLPEDWIGHPLRKDYEFPEEYHGISCK